jgi:hypothetical protein
VDLHQIHAVALVAVQANVGLSVNGNIVTLTTVVLILNRNVRMLPMRLLVITIFILSIDIHNVLLQIHVMGLFIFSQEYALVPAVLREVIIKSAVGQMVALVLVQVVTTVVHVLPVVLIQALI